jgi:hypothetical protein
LALSAAEEMVAMDNIAILEKNGFRLHIDPLALPQERVKLKALPYFGGRALSVKGNYLCERG